MENFVGIIQSIEEYVKNILSSWPPEWTDPPPKWPGYVYEHTLRVRNLSMSIAQQLGADEQIVELAAMLHDIGKPEGEPHAEIGAYRAKVILSDLGVDTHVCSRICHIIQTHVAKDAGYPIENLVICDADLIDSSLGYVGFARYVTIHANRGETIQEMITNAVPLLSTFDERKKRLFTDIGQLIAHERFERSRSLLDRLLNELENKEEGNAPAIGITAYIANNIQCPSLFYQVEQMEKVLREDSVISKLQPSIFLSEFVQILREEIAGKR